MDWGEILTKGMKLEQDGREFYLRAAALSADAKAREMFRKLADDELAHYNYLQRQYAAVMCGEDWCVIPELDKVEPVDLREPIFPAGKDLAVELPANATLKDVLLFALAAEDKSFKLYRDSAAALEDAEGKQMFAGLAGAELKHFELLMQTYESFFGYPG